jgi:hypothetical protein
MFPENQEIIEEVLGYQSSELEPDRDLLNRHLSLPAFDIRAYHPLRFSNTKLLHFWAGMVWILMLILSSGLWRTR